MPQFLSSINHSGTDLGSQTSLRKNQENSSQVSGDVRELELHVCDLSNIQNNFQTATDALQDSNVVQHHYVDKTTCNDR
jgi:hypothetical protein